MFFTSLVLKGLQKQVATMDKNNKYLRKWTKDLVKTNLWRPFVK